MWKKGESGNGGGSGKRRLITGHIERELLQECKELAEQLNAATEKMDTTKARAIAKKVVEMAVNGNPWAIQFVTERTEGRPDQNVNISRSVRELSDAELASIAAGSSARTSEETTSAEIPSQLH